jgi:hypothetical protein
MNGIIKINAFVDLIGLIRGQNWAVNIFNCDFADAVIIWTPNSFL